MTKAGDHYVRKAVSFNPANPEQLRLYEWAMKRANGNFSAYVKKTLAAEYQRHHSEQLTDKQRKSSDSTADKHSDNKHHNPSPPIHSSVSRNINVSIGNAPKLYTKE